MERQLPNRKFDVETEKLDLLVSYEIFTLVTFLDAACEEALVRPNPNRKFDVKIEN